MFVCISTSIYLTKDSLWRHHFKDSLVLGENWILMPFESQEQTNFILCKVKYVMT